jgi:filamentous hemagglutinin family protein
VVLGLAAFGSPSQAQVVPTTGAKSLGTVFGCSPDCTVTGGTRGGSNLFHRFDSFRTTSGQNVNFATQGAGNVFVGVTGGTVLNSRVGLDLPVNLFWLSPAGITINSGGGFTNVGNLTLSTSRAMRVGSGVFDVFDTTSAQATQLTGAPGSPLFEPGRRSDIVLGGGVLSVARGLDLHAGEGSVVVAGAAPTVVTTGSGATGAAALTTAGTVSFADAGSLRFEAPFLWTSSGNLFIDGGASDPVPLVSGPVTLRNLASLVKSSRATQRLQFAGFENVGGGAEIELRGGTLVLDGPFPQQTGRITLDGTFDPDVRLVVTADPFVNRGTIAGIGALQMGAAGGGTLVNSGSGAILPGILGPPGEIGTLGEIRIEGNFRQSAGSGSASGFPLIDIDIRGEGPGSLDSLLITGRADLQGGVIDVAFLGGFDPNSGDTFPVLTARGGLSLSSSLEQRLPPGIVATVDKGITYQVAVDLAVPLVDQKLFLLTGQKEGGGLSGELLALLQVDIAKGSFSPLGSSPASVTGTIGPTLDRSPESTRQEFLEDELEAERLTRERLGLAGAAGAGELSPEELQKLLQQVRDQIRARCREGESC